MHSSASPRLRSVLAISLVLAACSSSVRAQKEGGVELPPPPLPTRQLPGSDLPTPDLPASPAPARRLDPGLQPNFVLILADDMAWDDLGAFGNKSVRTPNLDRLAAEGMAFEQAFLTTSSCSPSRASILTGRYPHQTDAEQLHWPVPESQLTFVQQLRTAGYWTAAAGKWHLGEAMRDRFDVVREVDTSGFQLPANAAANADAGFVETSSGVARSGCSEWVPLLRDRPTDKPFFLWLAAVDPHRPYDEGIIENPHSPEDVVLPPYHPDTPLVRRDYARYYDEITRLDRFIGAVLDELTEQVVVENTLVMFLSDNGRPFPRDKTTLYDSGIRTPLIIRWPAVVEAGSRCTQLVSSVDIASTFLGIAGIKPGPRFVGKDFTPLLKGEDVEIRDAIFAEKNWHDYEDRSRAVRDKKFKYIANHYNDLPGTPPADAARSDTFREMQRLLREGTLPDIQSTCFVAPRPAEELYELTKDPFELHNLAADPAYRDTLDRLRVEYQQWQRLTKVRRPAWRTPDEFDRKTGAPTPARIRPRWSKAKMIREGVLAP